MEEKLDRTFEAFKRLVPHLRGSLWWGDNDLIKSRTPAFNQRDKRKGHPLLSLRKDEVKTRMDVVPMLHGTSGKKMSNKGKKRCIVVTGMTHQDRNHVTYFGSIIAPGLYDVADMVNGSLAKPRKTSHRMVPNRDKPMVSESEMEMIEAFCLIHQL